MLEHQYEITKVQTRLQTSRQNATEHHDQAIALEKACKPVAQSLSKFIADADEREAVARAVFNSKANAASTTGVSSTEASVAAMAGNAQRELTALGTTGTSGIPVELYKLLPEQFANVFFEIFATCGRLATVVPDWDLSVLNPDLKEEGESG